MSRVGRLLAAATLICGLFASASPVVAARPGSFTFDACWSSATTSVHASITWSGFRVDNYAFGQGLLDGSGFAFFTPIDTASSGTVTNDYGVNLTDDDDLIGGSVYFHGLRHAIKSDEILRPPGGWSTLDAC
jgi:hypothetical protein